MTKPPAAPVSPTLAPLYQPWLSAGGLQPQDNAVLTATHPWLGFRIGAIGTPGGNASK